MNEFTDIGNMTRPDGRERNSKPLPVRDENLYTWAISDTHFFHRNIIEYASRPENHHHLMISNWKRAVGPKDMLLHLGDLALGKRENLAELRNLPGRKTLLRGNHDRRGVSTYRDLGYRVIKKGFSVRWNDWLVHFVHNPADAPPLHPNQLVVHGHIHEKIHGDPRYINLCVEQTDYSPVWLPDVLDQRIRTLSSPRPA